MSNKRLSKDERRRINTRKKRDKKAAAQTKRFASLKIPIIDTVRDAFQLRDGGLMYMYDVSGGFYSEWHETQHFIL